MALTEVLHRKIRV